MADECRRAYFAFWGPRGPISLITLSGAGLTVLLSAFNGKLCEGKGIWKITQTSAWFMAHRLREAFASETGLFTGQVEADETYMGG